MVPGVVDGCCMLYVDLSLWDVENSVHQLCRVFLFFFWVFGLLTIHDMDSPWMSLVAPVCHRLSNRQAKAPVSVAKAGDGLGQKVSQCPKHDMMKPFWDGFHPSWWKHMEAPLFLKEMHMNSWHRSVEREKRYKSDVMAERIWSMIGHIWIISRSSLCVVVNRGIFQPWNGFLRNNFSMVGICPGPNKGPHQVFWTPPGSLNNWFPSGSYTNVPTSQGAPSFQWSANWWSVGAPVFFFFRRRYRIDYSRPGGQQPQFQSKHLVDRVVVLTGIFRRPPVPRFLPCQLTFFAGHKGVFETTAF